MPLSASWVDALFERLAVRYGAAFQRQYADLDIAAVKADWADVLGGFGADAIKHGLSILPPDKPVNAMQFAALCRRAPEEFPPALPAPKADPARVSAAIASIGERQRGLSLAAQCIVNIMAIDPKRHTQAHRAQLEACATALTASDVAALRDMNIVFERKQAA